MIGSSQKDALAKKYLCIATVEYFASAKKERGISLPNKMKQYPRYCKDSKAAYRRICACIKI